MTKPRGVLNRNAFSQWASSLGSGILRSRLTAGTNSYAFDVNQAVVQLQKNQSVVDGAGRLTIAQNALYIPEYTMGVGATAASGYTTLSAGIYQIDASVACSGAANIGMYAGAVLIDGAIASGTQSFQYSGPDGATCVNIHGVVHADVGAVLNVGVRSLRNALITVGSEDLVHAPAANMTVVKLGSDELTFNG